MIRPYIIGIAGGSGSGKTFFLKNIRQSFHEGQVCIISQDNYYKALDMQASDKNGETNFDLPDAIDSEAFYSDIQRLAQGKTVERKEYNFNQKEITPENIILNPAPIIVVEGLFILYLEKIKALLDLKIFMESRDDIKLYRRLQRDATERGISEETIMYQWHEHVYPAFKKYLMPYQDESDIIITNNYAFAKAQEVILDHIRQRLILSNESLI